MYKVRRQKGECREEGVALEERLQTIGRRWRKAESDTAEEVSKGQDHKQSSMHAKNVEAYPESNAGPL